MAPSLLPAWSVAWNTRMLRRNVRSITRSSVQRISLARRTNPLINWKANFLEDGLSGKPSTSFVPMP